MKPFISQTECQLRKPQFWSCYLRYVLGMKAKQTGYIRLIPGMSELSIYETLSKYIGDYKIDTCWRGLVSSSCLLGANLELGVNIGIE